MLIVTPSYAKDFENCRRLNESIRAFAPPGVRHQIVVDARDARTFASLANDRTELLTKQEILPRRTWQLPRSGNWKTSPLRRSCHGWFMQQIVKIRMAEITRGDFCILADSDVAFIRPFVPEILTGTKELPRMRRKPPVITSETQVQTGWTRLARTVLGLEPQELPYHGYISNLISWHVPTVRSMLRRIEDVSERSWYDTLTRLDDLSEYVLYGQFADSEFSDAKMDRDVRSFCHGHWPHSPMTAEQAVTFIEELPAGDIAIAIQSVSHTPQDLVSQIVATLTDGALT